MSTVWVALRAQDDTLSAGPFDSREQVEELFPPADYDDVYAAEVDQAWFAAQWVAITDQADAAYAETVAAGVAL